MKNGGFFKERDVIGSMSGYESENLFVKWRSGAGSELPVTKACLIPDFISRSRLIKAVNIYVFQEDFLKKKLSYTEGRPEQSGSWRHTKQPYVRMILMKKCQIQTISRYYREKYHGDFLHVEIVILRTSSVVSREWYERKILEKFRVFL